MKYTKRKSNTVVRFLDESSHGKWDEFVSQQPECTFFHRAGWRTVLERTLHHRCFFLFAEADNTIVGILPLVQIKSGLFRHALISLAFGVYGGPVAVDPEVRDVLDASAVGLAKGLAVDYLEYRLRAPGGRGWARDSLYATFRKQLDPDPDRNLAAIPRKQRAMIRKGEKSGLKASNDTDVGLFYRVYAESVRNLGTPVLSKRYFSALKEEFGDACEILLVSHNNTTVSGVLSFYFRDEVLPYYGGSTRTARKLAANDYMYWMLMKDAVERGIRIFDFGRSKKGTGAYAFKQHWGFKPETLFYEFKLLNVLNIPQVNPANPRYKMLIKSWKRLPLPVANLIGPRLAKSLG